MKTGCDIITDRCEQAEQQALDCLHFLDEIYDILHEYIANRSHYSMLEKANAMAEVIRCRFSTLVALRQLQTEIEVEESELAA